MLLGIFTNTQDLLGNQFFYLNDFIFSPILIYISYLIVKRNADKKYKNTIHYNYLMNAWKVRIICSLLFVLYIWSSG